MNSQLIGKDLDAGKDRRREEKRETEDEIVGWHHQLSGHECEFISFSLNWFDLLAVQGTLKSLLQHHNWLN